ncbi:nuclear transport factor 2 family protein [Camelimonas abortus]|uniref:Nuclear transport factor 2 family protein n=1 Tax=Camelimonas abortus TaxID=1017184 RepID=A0ABV7LHC7_9HYPH
MKRAGLRILAAAVALAAGAAGAAEKPPAGVTGVVVGAATGRDGVIADPRTGDVAEQIMAVRRKVREAVRRRDRAALEKLYHERFTHLRETGRAETRKERIDFLLSGQTGIELAPADQALVETYSPDTAVLSGVDVIHNRESGRSGAFQWLQLFVRGPDGHWRIALSQANRTPRPE